MSQYVFGTGQLFATPVGGGAPLRFGALQDVSVDFSGDIKMLHGQYQFALDVARGKTKVEWKASSGNIDVASFNQLFFGEVVDEGDELVQVINETGSVPAMSTYTVTAAQGANFFMDLGVYLAADGTPLQQVATTPGDGEYTVSVAGVYTFNAAQASAGVLLNYLYESASTGGSIDLSNQLMGSTPRFQLVLSQVYNAKTFTVLLYSNVAEKLSLPLKQDDYLIAEFSGQAFADEAGRVARLTSTSILGGGA
jgi:hypothetical protein